MANYVPRIQRPLSRFRMVRNHRDRPESTRQALPRAVGDTLRRAPDSYQNSESNRRLPDIMAMARRRKKKPSIQLPAVVTPPPEDLLEVRHALRRLPFSSIADSVQRPGPVWRGPDFLQSIDEGAALSRPAFFLALRGLERDPLHRNRHAQSIAQRFGGAALKQLIVSFRNNARRGNATGAHAFLAGIVACHEQAQAAVDQEYALATLLWLYDRARPHEGKTTTYGSYQQVIADACADIPISYITGIIHQYEPLQINEQCPVGLGCSRKT